MKDLNLLSMSILAVLTISSANAGGGRFVNISLRFFATTKTTVHTFIPKKKLNNFENLPHLADNVLNRTETRKGTLLLSISLLPEDDRNDEAISHLGTVLDVQEHQNVLKFLAAIPRPDISSVLKAAAPLIKKIHSSKVRIEIINKLYQIPIDDRIKLSEYTKSLVQNDKSPVLEVLDALHHMYWARRHSVVQALQPLIEHLPKHNDIVGLISEVYSLPNDPLIKKRAIARLLEKRMTDKNKFSKVCKTPSLLPILMMEDELMKMPGIDLYYRNRRTKTRTTTNEENFTHNKQ